MKPPVQIVLCAVVSASLFCGCATVNLRKQSNKLQVGMSIEEVSDIMGKPYSTSANGNVTRITYGNTLNGWRSVDFVDGKAASW